jgi:hypothetical protein
MFGKTTRLTLLQTRKRLLLAESELNRAELLKELAGLKSEMDRIKKRVHIVRSVAPSIAALAAVVSIFRRNFSKPANSENRPRKPWTSALLKGARAGASLWFAIKSCLR